MTKQQKTYLGHVLCSYPSSNYPCNYLCSYLDHLHLHSNVIAVVIVVVSVVVIVATDLSKINIKTENAVFRRLLERR